MVSIPTVVGVITCGFLLCLGLSNTAQGDYAASAADEMKAGQSSDRRNEKGQKEMSDQLKGGLSEGSKTVKGEVLGIEGDNLFVKGQDGKKVRLHVDETTQKARNIEQGERIEAQVNDQNHALSILSAQAAQDRRNDKE
jgi:hypothetical protein